MRTESRLRASLGILLLLGVGIVISLPGAVKAQTTNEKSQASTSEDKAKDQKKKQTKKKNEPLSPHRMSTKGMKPETGPRATQGKPEGTRGAGAGKKGKKVDNQAPKKQVNKKPAAREKNSLEQKP